MKTCRECCLRLSIWLICVTSVMRELAFTLFLAVLMVYPSESCKSVEGQSWNLLCRNWRNSRPAQLGASLDFLHLETWGERLFEFLGLLRVLDDQRVEETTASHLELDTVLILLDLHGFGIFPSRCQEQVLNLVNLSRHVEFVRRCPLKDRFVGRQWRGWFASVDDDDTRLLICRINFVERGQGFDIWGKLWGKNGDSDKHAQMKLDFVKTAQAGLVEGRWLVDEKFHSQVNWK